AKVSFDPQKIHENALELINTVSRLKPASAKGTYFKSISISSTMSPGISIEKGTIAGL
ncbi:MAG: 50S ribosomal protein L1, partial [Bacteroidota bacterium]